MSNGVTSSAFCILTSVRQAWSGFRHDRKGSGQSAVNVGREERIKLCRECIAPLVVREERDGQWTERSRGLRVTARPP